MSLTYPLTMPTSPGFKTSRIIPASNAVRLPSPLTGVSQAIQRAGDHWEGTLTLPPMDRAQAAPWTAFFSGLFGTFGTFYAFDPDFISPLSGIVGATPQVDGAGQIGTSLLTKNWPAATLCLKAGDMFQIGNQYFKNLKDVTSDGSGGAVLDFFPTLRFSPTDAQAITIYNPKGIFCLTSNDPGWDSDEAMFYSFSFAIKEAL